MVYALLEMIGLDTILAEVEDGLEVRDIAAIYEVPYFILNRWLNRPDHIDSFDESKRLSADAWEYKGNQIAKDSTDKFGQVDSTGAKNYAARCSRIAGIRNSKHSDKPQVAVQINNGMQGPLALPSDCSPIEASKAYAALIGGSGE